MADPRLSATPDADRPPLVLIVEDEINIALALEHLLAGQGYMSRSVADGQAALEAVAEEPPDLVLLDVMLPRRSGYEVCAAIRRDPALARTKILMMTASGRRGDAEHGLGLGADGFIAKPFATADLRLEVARLLAG
ncbi:MAG: response regulator [Pseudomonadota bacterium]